MKSRSNTGPASGRRRSRLARVSRSCALPSVLEAALAPRLPAEDLEADVRDPSMKSLEITTRMRWGTVAITPKIALARRVRADADRDASR